MNEGFKPDLMGFDNEIDCEMIKRHLPCGICMSLCDQNLTIIEANESYYQVFGFASEMEAKNLGVTTIRKLIYPADYPSIYEKIKQCISGKIEVFESESRRISKAGSVFWLLSKTRYFPESGIILSAVFDITRRKNAEERLRISEEEYRIASEHSGKIIIRYDLQTKTLYQTPESARMMRTPMVVQNAPFDAMDKDISDDTIEEFKRFYEVILRGEPKGSCVFKIMRSDGAIWFRCDFTTIFDSDYKPLSAVISLEDITEAHEREIAYLRYRSKVDTAVQMNGAMYYEYNLTKNICERQEGSVYPVSFVSKNFTESTKEFIEYYVHPDYRQEFKEFFALSRLTSEFYKGNHEINLDIKLNNNEENFQWCRVNLQMIPDPFSSDIKAFVLIENIDKQKQAELLLQSRSETDSLTGLLNKYTFSERVGKILFEGPQGIQHALVMVDIDHFKQINDNFGHFFGDKVLSDIAKDLSSVLSSDDLIGRFGGDEIIVFLNGIENNKTLKKRIQFFCAVVHRELMDVVNVSGSFGVAIFPDDADNFELLLQKADIALYEAKDNGRNRVVFYSPDLQYHSPLSNITPIDS